VVVVVVVVAVGESVGLAAYGWECLEYNMHELILSGYELLYQRVVVGVVGLVVAGLTVALIVLCVHHLRDFCQERYKFSRIETPTIWCDFLNLYLKDEVVDKVSKHPTTHIEHSQAR
jgi:hypothetical protein